MVSASGIGKAIGAFILAMFIAILVFAYGFVQVTSYDSLKPVFTGITSQQISSQLTQDQLNQFQFYISQQCATSDNLVLPLGAVNLTVSCAEIKQQQASELPQYISEKIFSDFYYKDYDCAGFDCVKRAFAREKPEDLTVMISAKMNEFLKSLIPYLIAGVIIGLAIIIISVRKVFSILKAAGIALIGAGSPFIMILLSQSFLPSAGGVLSAFIKNVTGTFIFLYGIVFAAGIVMAVIGFVGARFYEKPEKVKERKKR